MAAESAITLDDIGCRASDTPRRPIYKCGALFVTNMGHAEALVLTSFLFFFHFPLLILHCASKRVPHPNHGYNFVNSDPVFRRTVETTLNPAPTRPIVSSAKI